MTALYRARIGPIHSAYYLPLLTRFEAAGRANLSWNWAAAGCTLSWMIFRDMWGAALVYWAAVFLAAVLLLVLDVWLFQWPPVALGGTVLVLTVVLPGLWGNAIFYAKCRKDLARAVARTRTLQQACEQLSQSASSRQRLIRVLLGNLALGGVVALLVGFTSAKNASNLIASSQGRTLATTPFIIKSVTPDQAVASAASSPELPTSQSAQVAAITVSAVSAPAPQVAASSASQPEAAKTSAPGFYLNVGLFADAHNAQRVQSNLLAAGLSVMAQEVQVNRQSLTRVRVGPFASEAQAKAVMHKIHTLKLEAALVKPS